MGVADWSAWVFWVAMQVSRGVASSWLDSVTLSPSVLLLTGTGTLTEPPEDTADVPGLGARGAMVTKEADGLATAPFEELFLAASRTNSKLSTSSLC